MQFTVEVERETDKRWIAEVTDLPGVMVYGTLQGMVPRHHFLPMASMPDLARSSGSMTGWISTSA